MTRRMPKKETIGFIGLGLMGMPMARNLRSAGYDVVVYNRSQPAIDQLVSDGATEASSPIDVSEKSTIVILMLPDTPAVENVVAGPDGLLAGLCPGKQVVDMGTTAVMTTRALASLVAEKRAEYVDAPVSGGQIGAADGTLTIMVGGTDEAFARAEPIFSVLGNHVSHVGGVGAGQVAKAANQVVVGLTICAVAEALGLAKTAGIDPEKVRTALSGGFAASRILELHGKRMTTGDFVPGGRVRTQLKDLKQAEELAVTLGLTLPATHATACLYQELMTRGDGDLDHSALFRLFDPELQG